MDSAKAAIKNGAPLYWASINMRAGMVVVSPIITLIGKDLGLSTIQLAWLTSIPVICFAFASPATTWMRRFGSVNQIITWALWLLATSLLLRATGSAMALYIFTIGVGIGIATLNVLLPIWVKRHGGKYSGLLTGIYVAMMGVTTSIAIGAAAPLAHLSSLGWQLSLLPWGVVALVSALWWQRYIRTDEPDEKVTSADINVRMFVHSKLAWQVMLVFGFQSMNAYATRAWLPTIMITKGFTMTSAGMTVACAGLVGSLLAIGVPHIAQRSHDQRIAIWAVSLISMTAYIGIEYGSHNWVIFWVYLSNIGQWLAYPMALLLIILRSPNAHHAQSLSAMVQTIGYVMGATAPLIAGALFDLSGAWSLTLWMLAGIALLQALAGHSAGRVGHVQRRDFVAELAEPPAL